MATHHEDPVIAPEDIDDEDAAQLVQETTENTEHGLNQSLLDLKEKGNALFKSGQYNDAIAKYGEAAEVGARLLELKRPSRDSDSASPSPSRKHDRSSDEVDDAAAASIAETKNIIALLFSNRSMSHLKLRNYKSAEKDALECIQRDASVLKAYDRAAIAASNLGNMDSAIRHLDRGIAQCVVKGDKPVELSLKEQKQRVQNGQKCLDMARELITSSKYSEAMQYCKHGSTLFPDCLSFPILMAEARAVTDPAGALQYLRSVPDLHEKSTDNPDYLYVRALATYYIANAQSGNSNAQLLCQQALELDPEHGPSKTLFKKCRSAEKFRAAGNEAYKAKNWAEAIEKYTSALEVDPKNKTFNALVIGNRSAVRLELKQYPLALSDVNNAIQQGNKAAKMYARRSKILEALERWDEATRDMESAAEEDPKNYRSEVSDIKKRAKLAKRVNWYKTLGIAQSASAPEIKKAYRKAAMEWHPDKWASASDAEKLHAEKKFKEVGEAHAILSDPQKRKLYDAGKIDNETDHNTHGGGGGGGGGFQGGGVDISQMFSMFGGMGGGMGGGRRGGGGQTFTFHM